MSTLARSRLRASCGAPPQALSPAAPGRAERHPALLAAPGAAPGEQRAHGGAVRAAERHRQRGLGRPAGEQPGGRADGRRPRAGQLHDARRRLLLRQCAPRPARPACERPVPPWCLEPCHPQSMERRSFQHSPPAVHARCVWLRYGSWDIHSLPGRWSLEHTAAADVHRRMLRPTEPTSARPQTRAGPCTGSRTATSSRRRPASPRPRSAARPARATPTATPGTSATATAAVAPTPRAPASSRTRPTRSTPGAPRRPGQPRGRVPCPQLAGGQAWTCMAMSPAGGGASLCMRGR